MTITLSGTPVIHTKRLILRAPEPWDCAPFCAFMASDRARFVGGTTEPGRAWRAFGAILGHWVMRGFGPFTIVRADGRTGAERAIGMAGPWFPDTWPEHEIGWMLWDDAHEGQGLAAEAAAAVCDHARTHLGWKTAVSYIDLDNARSIALARRLGAVRDPDAAVPPAHPDGGALGVWRHPLGAVAAAGAAPQSYERHSHERCTNVHEPQTNIAAATEAGSADPATRAAAILAEHRASIDRLDAILVYTLAERFKHTQSVGRLKAEHALPPSDPAREAAQIERLERLAREADLDPEFARKFLNFVISEVIRHHEQFQK